MDLRYREQFRTMDAGVVAPCGAGRLVTGASPDASAHGTASSVSPDWCWANRPGRLRVAERPATA